MPEFIYRAVTKNGVIVKNKVEESNKQALIRKLKENELMPIQVVRNSYIGKIGKRNYKKAKKNTSNIEEIMKTANSSRIFSNNINAGMSTIEKINLALSTTEKIKPRDLMVFTQNFYLLKKANFNNIHALSTIIKSTDNLPFKGILEDILAGVEAGDYMYTTMEYYSNVFPHIYVNMIKVGELSGS